MSSLPIMSDISSNVMFFFHMIRSFSFATEVQLIRAARLKQRFGLCVGCQVLVSAPTGVPWLASSMARRSRFMKALNLD